MSLVRAIQLSTGKVVKMGTFTFSDGVTQNTTVFGALYVAKVRNGTLNVVYNPYTKAEIRELRYITTGIDDNNFTWPPQFVNNGNYVCTIANVMVAGQGESHYELRVPFAGKNKEPGMKYDSGLGARGEGIYINGERGDGMAWSDSTPAPWFDYNSLFNIIRSKYQGFLRTGTYYPWSFSGDYTVVTDFESMDGRADSVPGGAGISYDDDNNPYGTETSIFGGGDGDYEGAGIDDISKIPVPDVPSISVTGCGFIKIYNPSKSQLLSLSSFLWSNAFDIDSFKKLFSDPMEAIIGLGVVPVSPSVGGSASVKFGDIDSGVSMPVVNNQYIQKNMGTVSVKKYVGCFMDYSPYTSIQIYLPYIGIRELSPDDVMNDTIQLDYNIDVLSGGCAALISTSKKGLLYQYNGSCIANIPLTAINYSGAIQNAVSALGSVATTVVGAVSGAAPLAAMGVAGLATSAANTAVNSKPQIQRSGSMGGAAGLMSSQKPYLIINRPRMSVPDKLNTFSGNTCNVTMKLSGCKGFTMIDTIHLSGMKCTDNERDELMNILRQGVIF